MTDTQTWQNVLSSEDFERLTDLKSVVSIAIQPQYSHAQKLGAFCKLFQDELDATPQLEAVLKNVADPNTACGVFLDWWGERVGASRIVTISGKQTQLDDETFRFLVFYRALANISDASAATMNRLLSKLIGCTTFVKDNQDMTISVHVLGSPTALQAAILRQYGLLNRAAGVKYNIIIQNPATPTLGFEGSKLWPFNQGAFNPAWAYDV